MDHQALLNVLIEKKALIVHCSRVGKGDEGPEHPLYPHCMRTAKSVLEEGEQDLSCSVVWPQHLHTFGDIGIVLRPRTTESVTAISPQQDGGSRRGPTGRLEGMGVSFSSSAVMRTFQPGAEHNEWTILNAETMGIYAAPKIKLEVATRTQVPDELLELSNGDTWIGSRRISLEELQGDFPDLPIFSYRDQDIVKFENGAWVMTRSPYELAAG